MSSLGTGRRGRRVSHDGLGGLGILRPIPRKRNRRKSVRHKDSTTIDPNVPFHGLDHFSQGPGAFPDRSKMRQHLQIRAEELNKGEVLVFSC